MVNKEGLSELIALIPELEEYDGSYGEHDMTSKDGVLSIGPYKYSGIAHKLLSRIHKSELKFPFDWVHWQDEAERICQDPKLMRKADLMTVRKLLTTHLRKERFCEGHFSAMCESGVILLILKRVKVLFDEGEIEFGGK